MMQGRAVVMADPEFLPMTRHMSLAARLEELASPELRRGMGIAARSRSLEFTWEAFHREFPRSAGFDAAAGPREELST